MDRVSLKQKVLDTPEILNVISKIPYLSDFLNSLYDFEYKSFFTAFASCLASLQDRQSCRRIKPIILMQRIPSNNQPSSNTQGDSIQKLSRVALQPRELDACVEDHGNVLVRGL